MSATLRDVSLESVVDNVKQSCNSFATCQEGIEWLIREPWKLLGIAAQICPELNLVLMRAAVRFVGYAGEEFRGGQLDETAEGEIHHGAVLTYLCWQLGVLNCEIDDQNRAIRRRTRILYIDKVKTLLQDQPGYVAKAYKLLEAMQNYLEAEMTDSGPTPTMERTGNFTASTGSGVHTGSGVPARSRSSFCPPSSNASGRPVSDVINTPDQTGSSGGVWQAFSNYTWSLMGGN